MLSVGAFFAVKLCERTKDGVANALISGNAVIWRDLVSMCVGVKW